MPGELRIRRGRRYSKRLLDAAGASFEAIGVLPRLSAAAFAFKYLLVKVGADPAHVDVCAIADSPIGVSLSITTGAEQPADIIPLPGNAVPSKMVASAAIALGSLLEPAGAGRVQTLTGSIGTHHVVGRALTAAAALGDVIDVIPMYFLRVI